MSENMDYTMKFEAVTSVPGGVGVMTVLEVIKNSIECYRRNK